VISIDDLSNAEISLLLEHAEELERGGPSRILEGSILATVFLEPSTRTRLSFEAAMHRLGGAVITSADPQSSSSAKGETLADTIRMVDGYADVIALRHPAAGAARAAAKVASAPILNAGDGGHEHPSQTLVDLYTLRREVGRLEALRVVLYGDLKYGRTAHSLVRALQRFGARILAVSEPGLELPDYVARADGAAGTQVTAVSLESLAELPEGEIDAIYVTRLQRERLPASRADRPMMPSVDARFLAVPAFSRAIVMHPLPRTTEIDPAIDVDRRAAYFRQAAFGVPVRMALLRWALGQVDAGSRRRTRPPQPVARPADAAPCSEKACISVREPSSAPAESIQGADGIIRCSYCESPIG
jgi:aspartate carbamoyltransferase catalytic subunit